MAFVTTQSIIVLKFYWWSELQKLHQRRNNKYQTTDFFSLLRQQSVATAVPYTTFLVEIT